jgi:hypothetical protein
MRRRTTVVALPLPDARRADERNAPSPPAGIVFEAEIDGSRLRVGAKDEVVIQCGKASITLRRNGKVIIKGTHVETHSTGTNRIKGGQVRVN